MPERNQLLAVRVQQQQAIDEGNLPDFYFGNGFHSEW